MIKEISIFIKLYIIRDLGFIPISKDFNKFYRCWSKWDHKKENTDYKPIKVI